jgi:trans-aconitate 2-methyltransferase
LLDLLAPQPGERVLDLGCGTGHLTAQIAAAGADTTGIDRSPAMIEQARQSYPGLRFEAADARNFSFSEPFDAVFSNAVLHWVREADLAVACVHRALKPGGRFVAEFGGKDNVQALIAGLARACRAVGAGGFESPWYFPSIGAYTALLEAAGLEVTYASLFERPTPLEGAQGMRHWVEMFAGELLERIGPERREEFFRGVENELRPILYRDGAWYADYRRLRIAARREGAW